MKILWKLSRQCEGSTVSIPCVSFNQTFQICEREYQEMPVNLNAVSIITILFDIVKRNFVYLFF
jgi:hypothetical protein